MMNVKKQAKKHGFVTFCSMCGHPLKPEQVAIHIDDIWVPDYTIHHEVGISINLCVECWPKVKENNTGGMEKAIKRYEDTMKDEKLIKAAMKRRNP